MKRAGFTLTELLTVVAIIALLASIMVPSFASVMDLARETSCKNNLSVLSKAVQGYLSDNDDFLPCNYTQGQWQEVKDSYHADEEDLLEGTDSTMRWWCNRVLGYGVQRAKTFVCPGDKERAAYGAIVQCGYGFNDTLTDPEGDGGDGVRSIHEIKDRERTVLVGHCSDWSEEPAISSEQMQVKFWPQGHVRRYDQEAQSRLGRNTFITADGSLLTATYSEAARLKDGDEYILFRNNAVDALEDND